MVIWVMFVMLDFVESVGWVLGFLEEMEVGFVCGVRMMMRIGRV